MNFQIISSWLKRHSWVWYGPLFLVVIITLIFVLQRRQIDPDSAQVGQRLETNNVLVAGHLYQHWSDISTIDRKVSLHEWDALVLAGDTVGPNGSEQTINTVRDTFDNTFESIFTLEGEKDASGVVSDSITSGLQEFEFMRLLTLNTLGADGVCELNQSQRELITDAAAENDSRPLVLVTHHALWAGVEELDHTYNTSSDSCDRGEWEDEILPLFDGELEVAISADGGEKSSFKQTELDGVRYVLTGSDDTQLASGELRSNLISMVRLQATEEGDIFVNTFNMGNTQGIDTAALADVPVYDVAVDEDELLAVYNDSPFYDSRDIWFEMIESAAVTSDIQRALPAVITDPSGETGRDAEISIRGNVGNHWGQNKKSWDIAFTDREDRQLKFIIPDDRGYINQLLIQEMAATVGSITPNISTARLIINDIDFGVYLVYEDFDKAFVELNDFNSDALVSKNTFVDHYGSYDVLGDLALGSVSKSKGDYSDQQNIATPLTPDNINAFFDQDMFARWMALQIYTGDRHQNNNDNFRYVLDRATGRFVVLTWDVYIQRINDASPLPSTAPQSVFWENPENQALTREYVDLLRDNTEEFKNVLADLEAEYSIQFANDAGLVSREGTINSQDIVFSNALDFNEEQLDVILGERN